MKAEGLLIFLWVPFSSQGTEDGYHRNDDEKL